MPNGLTLEFWDLSRHAAGVRWQVIVEARITILVTTENVPPKLRPNLPELVSDLGPEVTFAKQEVRNFIAESDVPELVKNIESELFTSIQPYVGHPEFAPRFIRLKFTEYQERQQWYPPE